ncbi:M64 family metallopeptidase [Hymenobacter sp. ASUV-10]|uniref:M64 family metallopeptidase n=1 Tax=Hymenobacter aranciens TaxID=3063996 RepID=A0ABT9BGW3_9BACT|nr:M64 family metallopeptidase [Hymenobacter sp. ASUV-10]MDO7877486.1 M64 family metallopeptidase [Hymenobacter sp. ASUV-10]
MSKLSTLVLLAALLLLPGLSRAQLFPVDTLMKNGPLNNRVNIVFVGDGYEASDMPQYLNDVQAASTRLFSESPLRQYQQYFNLFAIKVPSAESGTSHPHTALDCYTSPLAPRVANTYFRSAFDYDSIHRQINIAGVTELGSVLAASFPSYTVAVVLVNTGEYGGSGGEIPNVVTITANSYSTEVLVHELGHTFANLADEYWAGIIYAREYPNMTELARQPGGVVRWQSWLGTNGVGIYPYAEAPAWYHPHQNCKMGQLYAPFCSVCTEALIESIHGAVRPVDSFSPGSTTLPNPTQNQQFSLRLLPPTPNTLRVKWQLDGAPLAGNVAQVTVPSARLATGTHTIEAEVIDSTVLSHSITHRTLHRYVYRWDVGQTPNGTTISAREAEYVIKTYPNPVADVLTVAYTLPQPGDVRMTVVDAAGRRLHTLTRGRQAAGSYRYELRTADLNLRPGGVYTLVLDIDGRPFSQQLVKQ